MINVAAIEEHFVNSIMKDVVKSELKTLLSTICNEETLN